MPSIAPNGRSFFDGLSRALAADAQGFDGSWIRTSTLYDAFGRVSKSSRPYFLAAQNPCASGSFTYCSTFTYDTLGRVTKALQPNGGFTLTSYQGLTTVSTLRDFRLDGTFVNEVTTTLKNDLGAPATVTDAAGATTTFTYDALGETLTITDALGHQLANNVYDQRGRKTESHDADMGHWTYQYNSLGQLTSQTDAVGNVVTMTYDTLGRMLTRNEGAAMSSVWIYGNASNQGTYGNSIDKLVSESCTGTACGTGGSGGSYGRVYTYDSDGRPSGTTVTLPSASYYTTAAYDTVSGKMTDARAFSGFLTHYAFNAWGYESEIDDGTNHAIVYWKPNTRDAEMHLTQEAMGLVPGVSTGPVVNRSFDPMSGRVLTTTSGASNAVAALNTDWDTAGNLADRGDTHAVGWQNENFCYDAMNRLTDASFNGTGTSAQRCSNGARNVHMTYDATGNILSKSDTGTYSYGTNVTSGAGPHALTSIATSLGCTQSGGCTVDGLTNPTYAYDANGNMTSGAGRTVSYTSFNMTKTVTVGASSNSVTLAYDPDHARSRQTSTVGGVSTVTLYMNDAAANVMAENVKVGTAASQWKNYIVADGHAVAQRLGSGTSVTMTYFVLDHLGSVAVITDANGQTLKDSNNVETGRQFFDVWGRMRNADGSPDTTCTLPANSASTRGYTNQEQIAAVCLDNYNARLYDPQVGRFLTADPSDGSGLNRYWYVGDNPLSLTDPTGLCFLGCFWKSPVGKAAIGIAIGALLEFAVLPALEATSFGELTVEAQLTLAPQVASGAVQTLAMNAGIAGGAAGFASSGSLQSAALSAVESLAFFGAGRSVDLMEEGHTVTDIQGGMLRAGLHGMIGGLASAAGHGSFASGFLAAGFGTLADEIDTGSIAGNAAIHAVAGGVGSMLGGGKFANGAVTGAFGYLFNDAMEASEKPELSIGYQYMGTNPITGKSFYHTFDELTLGGTVFVMRGEDTDDPGIFSSSPGLSTDGTGSGHGPGVWGKLQVVTGAEAMAAEEALQQSNGGVPIAWQKIGDVDMSWSRAVAALKSLAAHVNQAQDDYWPLSMNSNSVAFQGPVALGFKRPTPLPNHDVPGFDHVP